MEKEKEAIREEIEEYVHKCLMNDEDKKDIYELVDWIWDVVANYID